MAPLDVARRAIEERARHRRSLEAVRSEVEKRDDHNSGSHHHNNKDEVKEFAFPTVDLTPASTVIIATSSSISPLTPISSAPSITSFTTPEVGPTTNSPSTSTATIIPTTTQYTSSASISAISSSSITTTTTSSVADSTSTGSSSDQTQKQGDDEDDGGNKRHHSASATTTVTSATTIVTDYPTTSATALLDSSTPSETQSSSPGSAPHHNDSLSPTTEHLLIVFGTLGACIMAAFVVWLILRMRNGKFKELLKRKSPEIYSPSSNFPPSQATESLPTEKPPLIKLSAFYDPTTAPPPAAAELALADTQRQDLVRSALLENASPMGLSPAPPMKTYNSFTLSATEAFYTPQGAADGAADDDFRHNMYRTSDLSSLSSGFGDAKIDVPESGPTNSTLDAARKRLAYRTSRPMFSHFSWGKETAPGLSMENGNRDTVYTQASEAPRFRSIHSWVSQQTTRVERRLNKAKGIGERKSGFAGNGGLGHRRLDSEDSVLKVHPGIEIELERGSRVASSILDTKVAL